MKSIISNSIIVPAVPTLTFEPPHTFFTVNETVSHAAPSHSQNPLSVKVLKEMSPLLAGTGVRAVICQTAGEAALIAGPQSVAIFDHSFKSGEYSPVATDRFPFCPDWIGKALWGVAVKPGCGVNDWRLMRCARQTIILFSPRIFYDRIKKEMFPWGQPKRGTAGPAERVTIEPAVADRITAALNSGPNLAEAIADRAFAIELPTGSKISWVRVLTEPLAYSAEVMQRIVTAMRNFEIASGELLRQDPDVQRVVLSGVTLREQRLKDLYLHPAVSCFSVARPDLHWTPKGLSASENDEMPGGMPELVLLDLAYGLNADKWKKFFDWLTSSGPLLFLVSHEWSKCYIPEVSWLVGHLKGLGYDARMLTTNHLDGLEVGSSSVIHRVGSSTARIGAIWRQFPIFETAGKLADIVELARNGGVRLYPEWAHFGNKAWFHLFWKYQAWFSQKLSAPDFDLLRQVLPESHFIVGPHSFPITVCGMAIESVDSLRDLSEEERNQLVLKICGANSLASRSHGVLMGKGLKATDWSGWVYGRMRLHEPFLVQAMFNPGIVSVPVWHTKERRAEIFRCKVLMRPWVREGKIVSVHACAVPGHLHKVHGMVSMAVSPVQLVDMWQGSD